MKDLYKVFYENDIGHFDEELERRLNSPTTVRTNFFIKPMKQSEIYQLFYVPTNSLIKLVSEIYYLSRAINDFYHELPRIAQKEFIFELLTDELFQSNELEGVKSSRKEIAMSVRGNGEHKNNSRFGSLVNSYFSLLDKSYELPTKPQHIRNIYDQITDGEIEKNNLPDGDIFRKEVVEVLKKSGTGKVIHRGIVPEEKIVQEMTNLLSFMNKEEDIPPLIKIAIGHYYFGYIHPFYDGNGRTSRFISSLYLSEEIGEIPAISLSQACYLYANKYMESFEITNSIMNGGELNYFIESFLQILNDTLKKMILEIKEKNRLLQLAQDKILQEPKLAGLDNEYFNLMYVLAQNHFFAKNEGLTVQQLAPILNLSESTARNMAKELLNLSLIKQQGIRPAYFYIDENYFEQS